MRAVAFADFGAPPTLTDLPRPQPAAGEVLIRVQASSVNGFDLAVLGGMFKAMMPHKFPVVLGKDFAGTVTALGDDVTRVAVGDPVFGVVTGPAIGVGGFAEYVVVNEGFGLARIPDGLDHARAGALGLAATAALNAVDAVTPAVGETVLICGATGGVGAYAIQLAAARGAHVIATARPGAETGFVRDLGADSVVDHTRELPAQVLAIAPAGVAAALHLAGDGEQVASLLAVHGRLASTLGYITDHTDGRAITATAVTATPDNATLERLAADAANGRLRIPINRSYPLAEVPGALGDFTSGAVGKLAVTIN